jgi:multicomponent Na+:H+ antiporter subunit G
MLIIENGLLLFCVLSAWLGALAFGRLTTVLDKLHCLAFVNVTAGICLVGAALIADAGLTTRTAKIIAIVLIQLISGAATVVAAGRAIVTRSEFDS